MREGGGGVFAGHYGICEGWWFPKVTALFGLELGLVPSDCILSTTSAALHTTEQSCIRVSFWLDQH